MLMACALPENALGLRRQLLRLPAGPFRQQLSGLAMAEHIQRVLGGAERAYHFKVARSDEEPAARVDGPQEGLSVLRVPNVIQN